MPGGACARRFPAATRRNQEGSKLAAGMPVAEIVDAYPSLTAESVRGVLRELAQRKELQAA